MKYTSIISWGLVLIVFLLCLENVNACNRFCYSCADCTAQINAASRGEVICLARDIIDHAGDCIYIYGSHSSRRFHFRAFDCRGHVIDGVGSGYGIYLHRGGEYNTIKNCVITDFTRGIFLFDSHHNIITNNKMNNNGEGLYLRRSTRNILTNNMANNNYEGIHVFRSSRNIINNNIVNNNIDWGIGLFGSSHNTLFNNTANNNMYGIYLYLSTNNLLINNIVNNSNGGIYLDHYASDNSIISNTVRFNRQHGFFASTTSTRNFIRNNIFCFNGRDGGTFYDIRNDAGGMNHGRNNTCDTVFNYNDAGATGCINKCIVMDRCSANIKYISNLERFKNYATGVGCGPNAIANVLHYHNLQPNTPEGVHRRYSEYFFPCPSGSPGVCISDVNMTKIFNNIIQDSSQLLTGLVRVSENIWNNIEHMCPPPPSWGWWRYGWDRRINRCVLKGSQWNFHNCRGECREEVVGKGFSCEQRSIEGMDHAKVCVWNKDAVSLYKEIDASRPLILLITGYTGKIYTLDSTCKVQEWRGDNVCRNPVTNTNISGGHFVTVVGYTNDKRYLVISPGYDYTTIPCTPNNGLILINADALTDYRVITFRGQ